MKNLHNQFEKENKKSQYSLILNGTEALTSEYIKWLEFKIFNHELVNLENTKRDLDFLKEMRHHANKAFEDKDIVSWEMLFKMIEDWIHELQENK